MNATSDDNSSSTTFLWALAPHNSTWEDNNITGTGNETDPPEVRGLDGVRAAFTILICSLIICGTIVGNSLICGAVVITRKLRTPSNLLIVSLAVSDLLVGALDMPFAVVYEVTGVWNFGPAMCDFWTSIDVLFCTASILNICVISIDRYLVITKPFQYAMKRTPVRMILMIGLVWIVSAIISIPPLFGWKNKESEVNVSLVNESSGSQCMVSQSPGYQFFATIGAFYLPLVIMVVIYSRIYMVSSRMNDSYPRPSGGSLTRNRAGSHGGGRTSNGNGHLYHLPTTSTLNDPAANSLFQLLPPGDTELVNGGGVVEMRRNGHLAPLAAGSMTLVTQLNSLTSARKRSRTNSGSLVDSIFRLNCRQRGGGRRTSRGHERKATRTLGVIMGAFVACWLPFFILALIRPFCHDPASSIPQWLNSLLLWLGFTNSLLNPIIYARFNREFRMPFKYILQCRCANINSHLRSEEFTEQFGRLPGSHHGSLLPPSFSTHRPTPPALITSGRNDSLFQPLPLFVPSASSPDSLTPSSHQSLLLSTPGVGPSTTGTTIQESHLTPTSQLDLCPHNSSSDPGGIESTATVPHGLSSTPTRDPGFIDADGSEGDDEGGPRRCSGPSSHRPGSRSSLEDFAPFEIRSLVQTERLVSVDSTH